MRKSALALSFVALTLLTACGGNSNSTSESSASASSSAAVAEDTTATVTSVVDGETLKVKTADDKEATVKLVNVVAPNASSQDKYTSCLAEESTKYLAGQLPEGTEINLKFDQKSSDDEGNLVAAVYKGEDDFINADIVAAGYAVPVQDENNPNNYIVIQNEQTSALAAGDGLFDRSIECTVPATLKNATTAIEEGKDGALESAKEAYDSIEAAKEDSALVQAMLKVPAVEMLEDNARKALEKAGQ